MGWASKRITAHEVDPDVSKGHEFQGTSKLVGLLGNTERKDLPTTYYLMSDRGYEPGVDRVIESTTTWYDSRKRDPNRPAEWRLYYPEKAGFIQTYCGPNDLMIIALRQNSALSIILAPAGSASEAFLTNVFRLGEGEREHGKFMFRPASAAGRLGLSGADAVSQLNLDFDEVSPNSPPLFSRATIVDPVEAVSGDQEIGRVANEMISRWPGGKLGDSSSICDLVVQFCEADVRNQPDETLVRWLEVAEASYWTWESEMMGRFLRPLRREDQISDRELGDRISERWMSYRQSRVSRAGAVMEEFLTRLFREANLKFGHGRSARIEGGKLPDFLFPGVKEYNDLNFPPGKLRILGSKTSFKDRWRQILAEGDRVKVKHGVTRDLAITSSLFAQMEGQNFIVVMPKPVLEWYPERPNNLIALSDFILEIREIAQQTG